MTKSGFANYPGEWWHFEYGTLRWAATTDAPAAKYNAV
jgi:D-alanyl-D-alanine dipeptidase